MAEEQTNLAEAIDTTETPAPSRLWIKNSKGLSSASLTFATLAFWITALAYVASIVTKVGPIEFRQFDPAACASFLVPCLALYFSRRHTEAKFPGG